MALRIYNTLTGEKENFVPLVPGKAGLYVCGVTVYDYCHIGHARANIVFDIIYRYLKYAGYDVTYVRNYTDIDDKIIKRANQEGVDYRTIADRYIEAFDEDMGRLGLAKPTVEPKATDHIGGIIAIIEALIARGHAYPSDGDVYFAVDTFTDYLKLSKRNLEEMQAGARVEVGEKKRNPMDFALWKGSKPGEPWWQSPWGEGRPGWHIECSAMSMEFLGKTFDFHGGGKDLIFPHHENEIAQSEAANGCQFVRYWLHNGFVNINSEKMSKSLGNFFTIREVLDKFDAETLRFFILSAHYRSPIDFSDQNLSEAQAGLERIYACLAALDDVLGERPASGELPPAASFSAAGAELREKSVQMVPRFVEAMDDDFNSAQALGVLFETVRAANRFLAETPEPAPAALSLISHVRQRFTETGSVLGLFGSRPADWLENIRSARSAGIDITPAEIEGLIAERAEARKARDFKRSDEIRDLLLAKGIQLLDSPQGTTWNVK
ncbi:cysteine--tRNA ligase [Geobacter sp. SVR]|uniref:cysteine--tRNA ligase n=1 Tax=Geobacter sp. SVR TaxID=2495594 RepID=UPI00143F017B|nr:cysteine--tRNA ligase [Geobacter sp. SVR]BCS52201.1 cysteine--tRNA ligase [Geobacter sp. SVR]GCF85137.1 cysteine--tRNA ligase [Geobacter sp. SVR]